MSNDNADHKDREHWIREMQQEKHFSDEIIKYLDRNNTISQEIFNSLSHELRTPIVMIKAYIDMLENGHFGALNPKQLGKILLIKENTDILIKKILEMLEAKEKLK